MCSCVTLAVLSVFLPSNQHSMGCRDLTFLPTARWLKRIGVYSNPYAARGKAVQTGSWVLEIWTDQNFEILPGWRAFDITLKFTSKILFLTRPKTPTFFYFNQNKLWSMCTQSIKSLTKDMFVLIHTWQKFLKQLFTEALWISHIIFV
jgi:hypothetical protein